MSMVYSITKITQLSVGETLPSTPDFRHLFLEAMIEPNPASN